MKKKKQRHRKIVLPLGLVLIMGLVIFLGLPSKKTASESQRLQRGTITELVSEPGNVEAQGKYEVYPANSGVVDQIFVKDGQEVKAGQRLFSVRSDVSLTQKQAAYANYQAAMSSLGAARQSRQALGVQIESVKQAAKNAEESFSTLESRLTTENNSEVIHEINAIRRLVDTGNQQIAALQSQYAAANQGIRAAEAQVQATRTTYEATQHNTITAAVTGIVSNVSINPGDQIGPPNPAMVSIGGSTAAAVPTMIIGDLDSYHIKISLNELDVSKVKVGQPAKITLDAFPDQGFEGIVTQVDTFGTDTDGVITYQTVISFPEPPSGIKPQMSTIVDITTNVKENVLLVSNQAIRPYQNGLAVQVKTAENTMEYRVVKLGIRGPQESEIIEGVTDNDEVIISDSE